MRLALVYSALFLFSCGEGAADSDPNLQGADSTGPEVNGTKVIAQNWALGWLYDESTFYDTLGPLYHDVTSERADNSVTNAPIEITPAQVFDRFSITDLTPYRALTLRVTSTEGPPVFCVVGDGAHGALGSCVSGSQTQSTDGQQNLWSAEVRISQAANADWWGIAANIIVTTEANWAARAAGKATDGEVHTFLVSATYYYPTGVGLDCGTLGNKCCDKSACDSGTQCGPTFISGWQCTDHPDCQQWLASCTNDDDCCDGVCQNNICTNPPGTGD